MTTARSEILDQVAAAIRDSPEPSPTSRDYRHTGSLSTSERIALFCQRTSDYHASVRRIDAAAIATAVETACEEHGAHRLVIPADLPAAWRPASLELIEDKTLTPHELDTLDGVVTGCTVAIAETGTIALAAGPHEGRRAITLVPDLHICVVEEDQIVELVPEATAILADLVTREHRPLTLVSGPSATSDIELSRVEGVHGPRTLVILVATKETP